MIQTLLAPSNPLLYMTAESATANKRAKWSPSFPFETLNHFSVLLQVTPHDLSGVPLNLNHSPAFEGQAMVYGVDHLHW